MSETPIGWAVCFASTHARSFSFTFQVVAGGAGREMSPFFSASAISALLRSELRSRPFWPFSGMKASRNTIEAIAGSICSATPEITQPP